MILTNEWLGTMTAPQAREYLAAGEFPPGSTGPKIEAGLDFVEGRARRERRRRPRRNPHHRSAPVIPINDCLGTITTTQAREYLAPGEFPPRIDFVERGGECIITSTGHVASAVEDRAGTHTIGVRP